MRSIAVFCGSRAGKNDTYKEGAIKLGNLLAEQKIKLIYGGSSIGLMGAIAQTVHENGGEVIGIIPQILVKKEISNEGLTDLRVVNSMHERKAMMYELSDGFIALPGGIGTLEEFAEVITWNAIGEHKKPCGLLNIDNYYDPFIKLADHMVQQGFMSQEIRDLILLEDDPAKLLSKFNLEPN
ncbi:TIGR00730 family Rossman fold protein [Anaerobacillus sp. MEB173]|uniref:LOG family protein n=1 Tax=Anaerobacillus sp. MEB173 TaxID=3383345 RepID=UPI003F92340F